MPRYAAACSVVIRELRSYAGTGVEGLSLGFVSELMEGKVNLGKLGSRAGEF
jgi:hypothetical protein